MSFRSVSGGNETWRILPIRNKKLKTVRFLSFVRLLQSIILTTVFCRQLPTEPVRLQLSFNVAVAGQVCVAAGGTVSVSACICSF
ncbi:hypothetical protein [Methanimicrococcus hongohii]|uniref:hypothetical protein n=1 Tax=Methanimicrococcus hongohii TaxID=3028295 RepID=UPI00292EE3DF|nr:hypothetical protein [Methanimicrococcus sp. Hf6]